jgi:hypothetical protein
MPELLTWGPWQLADLPRHLSRAIEKIEWCFELSGASQAYASYLFQVLVLNLTTTNGSHIWIRNVFHQIIRRVTQHITSSTLAAPSLC